MNSKSLILKTLASAFLLLGVQAIAQQSNGKPDHLVGLWGVR